jgi:hypothetical protein
MKRWSWLVTVMIAMSLTAAGAESVLAAQGKKQTTGTTKRDCKPPMSSEDYNRCGFGGGGRR